jgi:hypothetical protein
METIIKITVTIGVTARTEEIKAPVKLVVWTAKI